MSDEATLASINITLARLSEQFVALKEGGDQRGKAMLDRLDERTSGIMRSMDDRHQENVRSIAGVQEVAKQAVHDVQNIRAVTADLSQRIVAIGSKMTMMEKTLELVRQPIDDLRRISRWWRWGIGLFIAILGTVGAVVHYSEEIYTALRTFFRKDLP